MDGYDNTKNLTRETLPAFKRGDLDLMKKAMYQNWNFKKSLSTKISDDWIDNQYFKVIELGATGGKVGGAGGGGFRLLVAEPEEQELITKVLGLNRMQFKLTHS